jgi:hypothetical protein
MNKTEEQKVIQIIGTHNKYLIKKVNRENIENKVPKRRVIMKKHDIVEKDIPHETQFIYLKELKELFDNLQIGSQSLTLTKEKRFMKQEMERKISSYKHQDLLKKIYEPEHFIDMVCILSKLVETNMKCHYCFCNVFILYDNVREKYQWTVDRVDNTKGHTKDNYVISCLECNMKRRKQIFDKFMFTKTLQLIKVGN